MNTLPDDVASCGMNIVTAKMSGTKNLFALSMTVAFALQLLYLVDFRLVKKSTQKSAAGSLSGRKRRDDHVDPIALGRRFSPDNKSSSSSSKPSPLSHAKTLPTESSQAQTNCTEWVLSTTATTTKEELDAGYEEKWQRILDQDECLVLLVTSEELQLEHKPDVWMNILQRKIMAEGKIHVLSRLPLTRLTAAAEYNANETSRFPETESFVKRCFSQKSNVPSSSSSTLSCWKSAGALYAIQHGAESIVAFGNLVKQQEQQEFLGHILSRNETDLYHVQFPLATAYDPPILNLQGKRSSFRVAYDMPSLDFPHKQSVLSYYWTRGDIAASTQVNESYASQPLDQNEKPVLIPSRVFAVAHTGGPTLLVASSFWSLAPLPQLVVNAEKQQRPHMNNTGSLSANLCQSLIIQALLHDLDVQLVMVPAAVKDIFSTERSLESLRDTDPSLSLTAGSSNSVRKLVQVLHDWNAPPHFNTLPARMEDLYFTLHNHGYLTSLDVVLAQEWLAALIELGYVFPPVKRYRHDNILVSGQFNYAPEDRDVVHEVAFWTQKWLQVVKHVQAYAPFHSSHLQRLKKLQIPAFVCPDDRGVSSPMINMGESVKRARDELHPQIEGVLYLHDDALANLTELLQQGSLLAPFPVNDIIASRWYRRFPAGFLDAREFFPPRNATNRTFLPVPELDEEFQDDVMIRYPFKIEPDGTLVRAQTGFRTNDTTIFMDNLFEYWGWWPLCVPPFVKVHEALVRQWAERGTATQQTQTSARYHPFLDPDDGSFYVPSPEQSDFLFMPMKHADVFIEANQLIAGQSTFLECGFPVVVQMMRHWNEHYGKQPVSLRTVELCTSSVVEQGTLDWYKKCEWWMKAPERYFGVYHSSKIGELGLAGWEGIFDEITFGEPSRE